MGATMTRRQQVLEAIRVQVAKDGQPDLHSTRLYVENRISFAAYSEAVRLGRAAFNKGVAHAAR